MRGGKLPFIDYGARLAGGLVRRFRPVALVREAVYQIVCCSDGSYLCFAGDGFGFPELERAGLPNAPEPLPELERFCEDRISDIHPLFWRSFGTGILVVEVSHNGHCYGSKTCAYPVRIVEDEHGWWEVYRI